MIIVGDALEFLRDLPSDHYDCVVTSPPYWGLRDYGVDGQLGLEPTMQEHIESMVEICAEVHRVLKPSGTFWLNYGDCYAANCGYQVPDSKHKNVGNNGGSAVPAGLKPKDLCMIPNRLAIALQEWGWWVRSEIIWAKPNPMPESVTDRPASAHEKIWLLTKSARYFYDNEAVRVAQSAGTLKRFSNGRAARKPGIKQGGSSRKKPDFDAATSDGVLDNGRNLRNYEPAPVQVWEMATRPFPGAHFATFPPELVERCLLAGTSQKGCCAECGAPWVRDVDKQFHMQTDVSLQRNKRESHQHDASNSWAGSPRGTVSTQTLGWQPSCACNAPVDPARVLDPFGGAGTVGLVADSLNLDWTLLELNPEYAAMAEARIKARVAGRGTRDRCQDTGDMFSGLDAAGQ